MNEKLEIAFDATEFDFFQRCPCEFNFRHNLSRVPVETSKSLDIGGVFHVGFDKYYSALKEGKPWESAVQDGLVGMRLSLPHTDLDSETGDRCLEVFEENTSYWRIADLSFKIERVENPFIYVLFENEQFRISMTGKVDLVFTDNQYEFCPMDHKTFSRDFGVNRLNNQFINYCNATGSNYIFVNRVGLQTSLKPKDKYKRIPISYDPAYIEQWRQNIIVWAMRYLDCVQTGNWEQNFNSCFRYGRLCDYFEVCDTSGESNKEHKLITNFTVSEKWDISKSLV
jgi:hypothetical protein